MDHVPFEWTPTPRKQDTRASWLGLPVFRDYDAHQKFGKRKQVFRNSREFAAQATADAATRGKSAAILLTDNAEAAAFEAHPWEGTTLFFIVNVDLMRRTRASALETARAQHGLSGIDRETREVIQRLKATGSKFESFLKNELTAKVVLEWCTDHPDRVRSLGDAVATLGDRDLGDLTPFALEVLAALGGNLHQIEKFASTAPEPALQLGGAAALYAQQCNAIAELEVRIKAKEQEKEFQKFFERHHWMFGPHYVRVVGERGLIARAQYDLVLIGTDDHIDIIELKRPDMPALCWDSSHQCFRPSAELGEALGQVQHYLKRNDHLANNIQVELGLRSTRMGATIVIGAFEEHGDEARREALRTLNSHLSRIQIRTFTDVLESARAIQRHTAETLDRARATGTPK